MIFIKSNPSGTLARGSKYLAGSITDLVDPTTWAVLANKAFYLYIYISIRSCVSTFVMRQMSLK